MRHEVHLHADIPILEGVSRRQLEQAFAPLLEYLDADGLGDVKSLEPDEPGIKYDEKELLLTVCWTGEIGRSFHGALEVDRALKPLLTFIILGWMIWLTLEPGRWIELLKPELPDDGGFGDQGQTVQDRHAAGD